MPELITLKFGPPQIKQVVASGLLNTLSQSGTATIEAAAEPLLHKDHKPLVAKLDSLADSIGANAVGPDAYLEASAMIRFGASLALVGYTQSKFNTPINSRTAAIADLYAELGGIPDTYTISAQQDLILTALTASASTIEPVCEQSMSLSDDDRRFLLDLGGGLVRHHVEQTISLGN